jgi:bifunctional UDP-N-acetylglucosamine pyrophosphorylase/glucosamine-1-phosphate N-acetyltransferase
MKPVAFSSATRFTQAEELRLAFGDQTLGLQDGAEVTFRGQICLAPHVSFAGRCRLTDDVTVEHGCILTDVDLRNGTRVRAYSVVSGFESGQRNLLGPFCFIRDGCSAGDDVILGAHVEATRSSFGSGVKVSHRAFIGDATIGDRVIIGAGVVFCNFDGDARQATRIADAVTIGSGSLLVAPLTIGTHALVAAGSVVTKNLPEHARLVQKR